MTAQEITLDTVIGLAGTDTLNVGSPIEFRLRVSNTSGDTYYGATNGFRLYSPDGATWLPHIYYDTTIIQFPSVDTIVDTTYYGRWADNIYIDSIWDGGYFVNSYSDHDDSGLTPDLFGQGSDTIGFGGYQQAKWGLYDSFDEIMYTIRLDSIPTQSGRKTICLDSAFYRPSGYWRWSDPDTIPSWDGPHCFPVKKVLVQEFGSEGEEEESSLALPAGEKEFSSEILLAKQYFGAFNRGRFAGVSPDYDLRLVRADKGTSGITHVRFQQIWRDLDVLGHHVIVHVSSNGTIISVTGKYQHGIKVDLNSNLSRSMAEGIAAADGNSTYESALDINSCRRAILVEDGVAEQVWVVQSDVGDGLDRVTHIIDDASGQILRKASTRKGFSNGECKPARGNGVLTQRDSVFASYWNISVIGVEGWFLDDGTRKLNPISSCDDINEGEMTGSIEIWLDTAGIQRIVESDLLVDDTVVFDTMWYTKAAIDAYYYSGLVYDWALATYGYNSWNGNGADMKWFAYRDLDQQCNHCWQVGSPEDPPVFVWCEAPCDSTYRPLSACPEVVAHEWFHAIQSATSKLDVSLGGVETNAILEANAVMFGEAFKYHLDSNDPGLWFPGSRSFASGNEFKSFLDMSDPDDDSAQVKGADYFGFNVPCEDTLFDTTEYHLMQTVLHKWFQLLVTGSNKPCNDGIDLQPLGMSDAIDLVFEVNQGYLLPDIGIVDYAIQTCRAAYELSSNDKDVAKRVTRTFAAVGILDTLDSDADGFWDSFDNCPTTFDTTHVDTDKDWVGDACDTICCQTPGDVNHDQSVDIADLTVLVAFMFKQGPAAICAWEANANGSSDGIVDIADITYLVGYMFKSAPAPPDCPL